MLRAIKRLIRFYAVGAAFFCAGCAYAGILAGLGPAASAALLHTITHHL
jgi:hypothetical protein